MKTTTTEAALQTQGGAKAERSDKIKVDWTIVNDLCGIGCTVPEICAVLKCSPDTLSRRCKEDHGKTFAEYHAEYVDREFKVSLRRAMNRHAIEKGNPALLIFLAKNTLGMADKVEYNSQMTGDVTFGFMQEPQQDPDRIEDADTLPELQEGQYEYATTDAHDSLRTE